MRPSKRALLWALALGCCSAIGRAQPALPAPEMVLSTHFSVPITYEAALARLGVYYDEQVGRKLAEALPEIAPHCHFEVWHDIWVSFEPAASSTTVTLQRPTAGLAGLLVKNWMLGLAGRLDAPLPLQFKEEPPLHEASGDIDASRLDLVRALGSGTTLKAIATWQHAGMMVSPPPLSWVVMAPAGPHGIHRVTVMAETTAAARQLLARLAHGVLRPGICAAYSEEVELNEEVRSRANGHSAAVGLASSQTVYIPNVNEKYLEDKVRTEPEMVKRSAAALGQYDIRLRLDKSYHKVNISWAELTGYARATGKHEGERPLGQSALLNPRLPQGGNALTARTKLPGLSPGAYRVRVEGEDAGGQTTRIDERVYWFDGKTFEEL